MRGDERNRKVIGGGGEKEWVGIEDRVKVGDCRFGFFSMLEKE